MKQNKTKMKKRDMHIFAAAALVCILQGCSGCGEKPEPEEKDPVVRRMADKEYVAKIEKSVEEQRLLAKSASETMERLAKAEAAHATAEELAAISNELKKCYKAMEQNRANAQAIVRERMLKDKSGNNNTEAKQ